MHRQRPVDRHLKAVVGVAGERLRRRLETSPIFRNLFNTNLGQEVLIDEEDGNVRIQRDSIAPALLLAALPDSWRKIAGLDVHACGKIINWLKDTAGDGIRQPVEAVGCHLG